jgi:hypothetical protein
VVAAWSSASVLARRPVSIDIAADGDVGLGTASPDASLEVERSGSTPTLFVTRTDGAKLQLASGPASSSVGTINNFPILFFTNSVTRMTLATNGDLSVTGSVTATAFNPSSDRHIKENFADINRSSVLDRLARIPISTWNFIGDDGARHMGPMAQDFYAAFGLGMDDKHISTVDADGVAFAAIQELNSRNEALASENASLRGTGADGSLAAPRLVARSGRERPLRLHPDLVAGRVQPGLDRVDGFCPTAEPSH